MLVYDYRCEECAELFEMTFASRDEYLKTIAVTCPVCGTGRTKKIVSAPAVRIWWKDATSSSDALSMRPKFKKPARNRALSDRR